MTGERLQKVLARAGLGSRRRCEEWILEGRVSVNGRTAELGSRADPEVDDIRLDGERLPRELPSRTIALYKPRGVETSMREQGPRPTVQQLIPAGPRLVPVGRLDVDSEGLLLLTNDGDLALRLTHPRYGHEKEYRVLLDRQPDATQLAAWRRGVVLPDGSRTQPAAVRLERAAGKGAWVRVVLREGRKRQIRETARALGLRVQRLIRTRVGPLPLGDLQPGKWRELTPGEMQRLRRAAGLQGPRASDPAGRPAERKARTARQRRGNGHH